MARKGTRKTQTRQRRAPKTEREWQQTLTASELVNAVVNQDRPHAKSLVKEIIGLLRKL